MKKKAKDRHLDIPSEANRDKHINFAALENRDTNPADQPATGKLAASNNDDSKENSNPNKRDKGIDNDDTRGGS